MPGERVLPPRVVCPWMDMNSIIYTIMVPYFLMPIQSLLTVDGKKGLGSYPRYLYPISYYGVFRTLEVDSVDSRPSSAVLCD